MQQIADVFTRSGVQALFITDPHNMGYISGFNGEGMLYISRKQKIIITDSRYTEAAEKVSAGRGFRVTEENAAHKRKKILQDLIEEDKVSIVGYEDRFMHCYDFSRFVNWLPAIQQWLPMEDQITSIRQIKTPEEQEIMAHAEAIGDAAFADILKEIRLGMTELQLAAKLEYQMKMHGATGFSFSTIAASGLNYSMPHAVPGEKVIENGDFITMDFGCIWKGYCSDMTRTVVVGKANEKQKEIYGVVLEAQTEALNGLHAGMTGREADAIARNVITKAGYGSYFGHALGHSVGLYIHEKPTLSPADHTVLEPGMVETVEPGIYIPGFGGVRIEDMVIITENGIRNLTSSPKELIEL